jgi:hypothetical protein
VLAATILLLAISDWGVLLKDSSRYEILGMTNQHENEDMRWMRRVSLWLTARLCILALAVGTGASLVHSWAVPGILNFQTLLVLPASTRSFLIQSWIADDILS